MLLERVLAAETRYALRHPAMELKYWAATDAGRYAMKQEQLSEMQDRLGDAHSKIRQHHDNIMEEFTRLARSLSHLLTPGGVVTPANATTPNEPIRDLRPERIRLRNAPTD